MTPFFAGDPHGTPFRTPGGSLPPTLRTSSLTTKKETGHFPWSNPSSPAQTIFVPYKDRKELTPALATSTVFTDGGSVQVNDSTRTGANLTQCQSYSHHGGGPFERHRCQELWTCSRFVGVPKPAGTGVDSKWQELRLTGRRTHWKHVC